MGKSAFIKYDPSKPVSTDNKAEKTVSAQALTQFRDFRKSSQRAKSRSFFLQNFLNTIEKQGLSSEQIAAETGLDGVLLRRLIHGEVKPSQFILQRLSLASSLGVTYKTLSSWCVLDDSLTYATNPGFGF